MMKKQIMMMVAALAAVMSLLADEETVCGYTWTYRIDGDTAEVYGVYKGYPSYSCTPCISPSPTGAVTMPSTLGGKSVTRIGDYAFYYCTNLTSVTIPNSVTSIGTNAFYKCSSIASVTIPDSVTSIGDYAFYYCTNLTSVTIPDSVTRIGDYAFYDCSGLTSFSVASGNSSYKSVSGLLLTKDGKTLVCGVNGSVSIPDGVTSIGKGAFSNCSGLTSVTIPDSVTSIGEGAFRNCSGLSSVTIPDSVTSIGVSAFEGCSGLTSVTIPSSVTRIDEGAFAGCSGLTSVTIPNGVTSIGYEAFSGCSGLASLTIPDSVTNIGSFAFYNCGGLTSVTISDNVRSVGYMAFRGCTALATVTIPDSVTSIGDYAFDGCSGLKSVTIGNSVTRIGEGVFRSCSGLTSVMIGDSVTSIWSSAFSGCSGLKSFVVASGNPSYKAVSGLVLTKDGKTLIQGVNGTVSIPDSVTNIGYMAFSGCSGLASVTIPDSVTSIGNYAFSDCSRLEEVTVPQCVLDWRLNKVFPSALSSITNVSYSSVITNIGDSAFSGCSGLTSVTIPASVTRIGGGAFSGCYGIKKVTIPQYVLDCKLRWVFPSAFSSITNVSYSSVITNIGSSVFSGCSGLTSVTIPNSVTRIGVSAFEGCDGIKEVIIPQYVLDCKLRWVFPSAFSSITNISYSSVITNIGYEAFSGCSGLTSVTIPDSVTSIGEGAFRNCSGLSSVTIPDSVTSIGVSAFEGCSGLTSVTIPDSVTSIGVSAFEGCSGLTSVTIPDSVASIGDYAFEDCSGLTSVTIPDSVTSIGDYAFEDCLGLMSVKIGNGVTSIGELAFSGCSGLTSVTISGSVKSIGLESFRGCSGLMTVHIVDLAAWCRISFAGYDSNPLYYAHNLYFNGSLVTDLTIPSGVTSIGEGAFLNCSGLTSVTIPSSVTSIGEAAFSGCSGLTSVTIPNSVTSIGEAAFSGCSGLTSVTIPDSVASIGGGAFEDCSGLRSVTIGNSVTSIGYAAFSHCSGLASVTIPNSVTIIGDYVFSHCSGLTSVTIPDSVASIGRKAFSDCSEIKEVTISQYVLDCQLGNVFPDAYATITNISYSSIITNIGGSAFSGCSGLTSVTIPDSVTSIGTNAFYKCSSIASVTIPDSVTSIGNYAFYGCNGLTSVMIPESVTNFGYMAFSDCRFVLIWGSPSIATSGFAYPQSRIYISDCYTGTMHSKMKRLSDLLPVLLSCDNGLAKLPNTDEDYELKGATKVSVSCPENEITVRYTIDGSEPTTDSPVFSPFTVKTPLTVKIGAFYGDTRVVVKTFRFWLGEVAKPQILADGGLTFTGTQGRRVTISCATADAVVRYTLDGSEPREASKAYAGAFTVSPVIGETVTIRAKAYKTGWYSSEEAEPVSLTRQWGMGDSLGSPDQVFTSGGVAWTRCADGHGGSEALRSGRMGNGTRSWFRTTVTGSGVVSFWWKTSCEKTDDDETPWDHVEFSVDGKRVAWLDGETDWRRVEYLISGDGEHVLQWAYVKDASDSVGQDCAWVSQFDVAPIPKTYKVTFGKNGGTGGDSYVTATYGKPMPTPCMAPTKSGYVFEGYWDTTKEGGKQYYDANMQSVRNWDKTAESTLWAKWRKAAVVKVTFGKNGGTGGDDYVTATEGQPMPTPRTAPKKDGYVFEGYWDTTKEGGKQYYDGSMTSVRNWDKTAAVTLWAKWSPARYKVTFGKNGGTGGDNYVMATYGAAMPTPRTAPKKSGYVFEGYWTTTGTGGVQYYDGSMKSVRNWDRTAAVTLWAKWRQAAVVKVTLGKNGGTGGDNYVTATTGQPMPTPRTAPKMAGWTFAGYWDSVKADANGNPLGKQYYDANMKSVRNWDRTTAVTLWAKWTVRVTLGKNGGTGGDSYVTVTYGQPFPKRTMPTKSGYDFGGYWMSASSRTGQCYNADGTGTASMAWKTGGTPTVWALWTEKGNTSALYAQARQKVATERDPPVSAVSGRPPYQDIYTGTLADGTGAFTLEVGDGWAFVVVATERDAPVAAECEVIDYCDGEIVIVTEDGAVYRLVPDGK